MELKTELLFGWRLDGTLPDVEGMTWAVGMMDCEHMGLKEELSVKQQKSVQSERQNVNYFSEECPPFTTEGSIKKRQ